MQSTCREVLDDLAGFEYRDAAGFRSWLFTVALNKVRAKGRYHAAQRRDVRREAGSLDVGPEGDGGTGPVAAYAMLTPSQHAIAGEAELRLERAFDRLSEEHREVVLLARILRLPHAEVARRMQRSEVAVRSLLGRALVKLSAELEGGPHAD